MYWQDISLCTGVHQLFCHSMWGWEQQHQVCKGMSNIESAASSGKERGSYWNRSPLHFPGSFAFAQHTSKWEQRYVETLHLWQYIVNNNITFKIHMTWWNIYMYLQMLYLFTLVTGLNLNLAFIIGCFLAAIAMICGVMIHKFKRAAVQYQPLPTTEQ